MISNKTHDMTIGANHKLDLTTFGSGLDSSGSLSVGENTESNINMTMPKLVGGEGAGTAAPEKGAVKVGQNVLDLKPNTKLNIKGVLDPYIAKDSGAFYGLWLKGAGLKADSSTISIDMSTKPYEDPEYAGGIYGISSKTYVNMKNSSLTTSVNGDQWVGTAYGALALTSMTMDNCTANIAVSGSERAYGLAANFDQKLTSSQEGKDAGRKDQEAKEVVCKEIT